MRPVLLEMNGFASFKEPTTVDFRDADYFALIGPTGSGKSTVIDAITFALYGSVHRWDDQRTVAPALAPNVNRGTVKLVFDSGPRRYVISREMRRTTTGVGVRNVRLERLADPDALATPDDDTESLATDSGVTPAVEELLGLTFEQFCQCVVLPQGEFAAFLRARSSDRQTILLKLLGAQRYDLIARKANQRADLEGQTVSTLSDELSQYHDATEVAIAAATAREADLEILAGQLNTLLGDAENAAGRATTAHDALEATQARVAVLSQLAVPEGVVDLDQQHRVATAGLRDAKDAVNHSEKADESARAALKAAPARSPLERAAAEHIEAATLLAALPGLQAAQGDAAVGLTEATAALTEATAALETLRTDNDAKQFEATTLASRARTLAAEQAALSTLTIPSDLGDISDAQAAASETHSRAQADAERAQGRADEADAALAASAETTTLQLALGHLQALATMSLQEPDLLAAVSERSELHQSATAALTAALHGTKMAAELATSTDHAAALRPHLIAGTPCPVCDQDVATLPEPLDSHEADAARAAVAEAESALSLARDAERASTTALTRAEAELAGLHQRAQQTRAALDEVTLPAGLRADPVELTAAITRRATLETDQRQTAAEARSARNTVEASRRKLAEATKAAEAARGVLRTARDPLVALGAPDVDALELVPAWTALCDWAHAEGKARAADAQTTSQQATEANTLAQTAQRSFDAAKADLAAIAATQLSAVRAAERAAAALRTAQERHDALQATLAGAPDPDTIAQQLSQLTALETAAAIAGSDLSRDRAASVDAQSVVDTLATQITDAWSAIRTARDPLVPLGAPPLPDSSLMEAWTTLHTWAAAAAQQSTDDAVAAQRASEKAAAAVTAVRNELVQRLADQQVSVPAAVMEPGAPAQTFTTAVAGAVGAARQRATDDRTELIARAAQAARTRIRRDEAEGRQQVARMLASLLRSDAFPRWLASAALDALVVDASASLSQLSGGQFELTHDDSNFFVVDHTDADARRSVRTLSGGETFQASLSLALALSSQLGSLGGNGATLDSIFLDEGFGTLDEATLDTVAVTLENLVSSDRMVGVITHVSALAERVPVRFTVTRDQRTSSIEREDL